MAGVFSWELAVCCGWVSRILVLRSLSQEGLTEATTLRAGCLGLHVSLGEGYCKTVLWVGLTNIRPKH